MHSTSPSRRASSKVCRLPRSGDESLAAEGDESKEGRGVASRSSFMPPIQRSAWKRNSRKFAVASGSSTQWQALDYRARCTPLGLKRPRLGSSSCTFLYQGVATRNGATTREILAPRTGPMQTYTKP
jgi:hypothetical protein